MPSRWHHVECLEGCAFARRTSKSGEADAVTQTPNLCECLQYQSHKGPSNEARDVHRRTFVPPLSAQA